MACFETCGKADWDWMPDEKRTMVVRESGSLPQSPPQMARCVMLVSARWGPLASFDDGLYEYTGAARPQTIVILPGAQKASSLITMLQLAQMRALSSAKNVSRCLASR